MKRKFREWEQFEDQYDDLTNESFDEGKERAISAGFTVIERQPNQLLIDIDSNQPIDNTILRRLKEYIPSCEVEYWASKSGNLHARVTLGRNLSDIEALLLQAILGSDPLRELLGLFRVWNGVNNPIVLFKPKGD